MTTSNVNEPASSRTKIVATIGPASRKPEILRKLIAVGVDVFRLNFSHGTQAEHSAVLADIRTLSRDMHRHVAVLQDLGGPKMRLGPIPGDVVECSVGEKFVLAAERTSDSPQVLTCTYRDLPNDLKAGETVLFADGTVAMRVVEVRPGQATLEVTLPGRLRSRQGVNLPGSTLAVQSLTDKDLRDLDWTAKHATDIDFVGLSFARSAEDVARLRHELKARNCPARIIVKIEKPEAVRNIEDIIAATDGVMVARGDMGVEMDVQCVPAIQKRVIALCGQAHRPVITATQMLNSMEHSSRPTRAEASDVFNAVLDGTDAVMLSGESAVGEYPIEAVDTMRKICVEAEAYVERVGHPGSASTYAAGLTDPLTEASVDAARVIAERLRAPLIVVSTDSGRTALALSSRKPATTIVALARTEQTARALALCWGVTPLLFSEAASAERELSFAVDWARSQSLIKTGQQWSSSAAKSRAGRGVRRFWPVRRIDVLHRQRRSASMKVGIVGSGFVGATAGYAMVLQGVGREIVFVDKNAARAQAEAEDIRHAVPFTRPLEVRAGGYDALAGSRVVVICAGVGQRPGESRLQLLQRNAVIFDEVVREVLENAPEAVLLVASNPVDVMTHLTARYAADFGLPPGRVFGSGTTLDSARFRSLIGQHCGVDPQSVHAQVIGEHGDSEVLAWSLVTVGGIPLDSFIQLRGIDLGEPVRRQIDREVRAAAYSIIQGKGATYYGIGAALARIVRGVLHDERAIGTVCAPAAEVATVPDVTLSLPRLVGGSGVLETFPIPLAEAESIQLTESARAVRKALDELGPRVDERRAHVH